MNRHVVEPLVAQAAARPRPVVPLWLLALFTFSGTLGMHIFVPALHSAGDDLHASPASLQLTVSLYIFGLAVGQLVYGPISDRYGRRPTLLAGLALFTAAGLAAMLAQSVDALIVARFFQAMGGCAGLVLARAIVRDASAAEAAAHRLAMMNLFVTAGPGLAPLIGGALAASLGWRSIFIVLCGLGALNALLAWFLLPETSADATATSVSTLGRHYLHLLKSPSFLGYSIGGGCATTSLYAFIACAPFIFVDQLKQPAQATGFYLALLVSGIWLGSVLASRLIERFSLRRFLVVANALSVVGAFAFLAMALSGHLSVVPLVASMFLFSVGVGSAAPAALVKAISVDRHVIGSASGLYGFTQMAVGAGLTALVGLGRDPAVASATVLAFAGLVAQASFWIAFRDESRRQAAH